MTRKSLRFWLVPLLLGPACALALEIGEIQVSSALNQLFDARIPLLALTPEESEKVSVSLASKAMFKEFGLERTSALTNLVFSIEYNAEGLVYVRAVSTQPIREPSLGLLLEFNWPRGKTFREFTVFLDPVQRLAKRPSDRTKTVLTAPEPVPAAPVAAPPVAATAPPTPPVAAPIVAPPSSEQTESSAESLPVAVSPPPVKTYKPGDNYGPITPGEGLWGIALKVRPDPSISREHMMQALLKANPQAFSKAGVDGLKIGAVLRIPTLREIVDLTGSLAARQLAEAESPSSPAPTMADQTPSDAAPAPLAAESARVVTGELETFPLAPQAIPEPTVVVAPSSSAPEAVEPKPESKSEPKPAVAEPAVAAAEPEAPKPVVAAAEPEAPKPVVAAAEPETPKPVVAAAEPEAPKPEIVAAEPEASKPEIVAAEPEASKPEIVAAEPEVPKPVEPEAPKPEVSKPTEPETPKPEIVATEPETPKPEIVATEPETPKPEIVATEPETPKPEIVAVESEASKPAEPEAPKSVVMEPKVALPADQTASVVTESSSQLLMEPVSVTPLLFLATSEMIATIAQVPVTSISMPIASPSSVTTGVVASKAKTKTTTVVERLPVIAALPATIDSEPSPLLMDATSLLAEIEKFVQQTSPDASSQSSQSSPAIERATQPPIAELAAAPPVQAEAQLETHIDIAPEPQPSEASTSAEPANSESGKPSDATPVVKPSELSTEPAIHEPDQTLVESTVAEPIHSDYKGGDQYGPVSTNERLWDIAGKVRPNPGIGRDVMMKALFMANPQSFSKPDMNSLKVGAILRVPTLREIADYTDSKVARQLLEQQQATETQPAGAKAAGHSVPSASPATPPTETGGAVIHPAPATPSDGAAHEPSATPAAVQGGAIRDPRLAPPVVKVKLG